MAPKKDAQALLDLVKVSSDLVAQYLDLLSPNRTSTALPSTITNPPNPLQVLRDASLLLKSHTTKLSLLLLNKPFTPSAIASVLRQMTGTCLPAIMSAVEIAQPDVWGRMLRTEISSRVRRVMREMSVFLNEIRMVALEQQDKKSKGRDTLASTGVVWEACDALVALEELDVGGVALKKAQEYAGLVKDAIAELREWREDSLEGEGGEDSENDEEDEVEEEEGEDIFGATQKLPKDRPELVLSLDETLGTLRRIELLYAATMKRRIRTFTKDIARIKVHVQTLDNAMDELKSISSITDELASAFYDLDEESIDMQKKAVVRASKKVTTLLDKSWDGQEDEFTAWCHKWNEVVK